MELNLKFYKGKDEYSDGDIEQTIIDLIKKYPNDYEEAFKENDSWPVFYHLSNIRRNVVKWYPFKKDCTILEIGGGMGAITSELCLHAKKVTSIELSKRRATAILERNKERDNLEIIVGNFKDIKIEEKFDYILLNGVLEYGALYMDSDKPYEDFINKLKTNLKSDGKILIAIENKFGLKYWCGANEDHTGKQYDGLNNYPDNKSIQTFGKKEIEKIFNKCDLESNFYYMFPDYKFPAIIYSDSGLKNDILINYAPYYSQNMNVNLIENKLYESVFNEKMIPFFANSFFIELSSKKESDAIDFVKFNNIFRNVNFDLYTYKCDNKYYKKVESEKHLNKIIEINSILTKNKVLTNKLCLKKENLIEIEEVKGINYELILKEYIKENNMEKIFEIFDKIEKIIKKVKTSQEKNTDNCFKKFGVQIPKNKKTILYDNVLLDVTPANLIKTDNGDVLIDQEWIEDGSTIEYAMYRSISSIIFLEGVTDKMLLALYKKYAIDSKIYKKMNDNFLKSIENDNYNTVKKYNNNFNYYSTIDGLKQELESKVQFEQQYSNLKKDFNSLEKYAKKQVELINVIEQEKTKVENELNDIKNSKYYKIYKFIKRK